MTVKVLGIGAVNSGEYNGRAYSNVKLYVDHEKAPKNGQGTEVEAVSVPTSSLPSGISVGDYVDIQYNRYGRVDDVVFSDK